MNSAAAYSEMMSAMKQIWNEIRNHKIRTTMFSAAFFVSGLMLILSLAVSSAAHNAKTLVRKSMRAAVSYEIDHDGFWEHISVIDDDDEFSREYQNYPRLSQETAQMIAEDERVTAVNFITSSPVYSSGFHHVPAGSEDGVGSYIDESGGEIFWQEPDIMICAVRYPELIEIAEGTWTLREGRFLDETDTAGALGSAMITAELADLNGLKPGDSFHVDFAGNREAADMQNAGIDISGFGMTLTVVGIYETQNTVDPQSEQYWTMSPCESPENTVIIPAGTLDKELSEDLALEHEYWKRQGAAGNSEEESSDDQPDSVVFLLDDPMHTEAFIKDYAGKLADYTFLNDGTEHFEALVRPLDMSIFFARVMTAVLIIAMIVITALASALVFRNTAEKAGVLYRRILLMLAVPAAAGLILAFAAGAAMSSATETFMSRFLDRFEMRAGEEMPAERVFQWISEENCFTDVSPAEMLENYHIKLTPLSAAQLFGSGACIMLAGALIPAYLLGKKGNGTAES